MKKGDIVKLANGDEKLYLLCGSSGTGKEKVFTAIKYSENEKRFLTKIMADIRLNKKELKGAVVVEHYSPKAKTSKTGSKLKGGNEPFDWWNEYKLTNPTMKEFVCKLVEKYGHPYSQENSYLTSITKLFKGIMNDTRTQDEIDRTIMNSLPTIINGKNEKELNKMIMDELTKYVKRCEDLYGNQTMDIDYMHFPHAWTVEKYFGNPKGLPIKNYRYYHERFPDDEGKVSIKVTSKVEEEVVKPKKKRMAVSKKKK